MPSKAKSLKSYASSTSNHISPEHSDVESVDDEVFVPVPPPSKVYHFQGSTMRGYNTSLSHVFNVPSQTVEVTKGSLEFIADYHVHGLASKKQFLICEDFQVGRCTRGAECSAMHFPPSPAREVHYKKTPAASHDRLRPGYYVIVSETGKPKRGLTQFRSEDVFVTKGSDHYVNQWVVSGVMPKHKLQLCSHFEDDGFCPYGKECNFIHAAAPGTPTTQAQLKQQHPQSTQVSPTQPQQVQLQQQQQPQQPQQGNGQQQQLLQYAQMQQQQEIIQGLAALYLQQQQQLMQAQAFMMNFSQFAPATQPAAAAAQAPTQPVLYQVYQSGPQQMMYVPFVLPQATNVQQPFSYVPC